MHKYINIILVGCLVVLGVFYFIEKQKRITIERNLNNEIALLQGTIIETQTAASVKAREAEDLKIKNKQLQDIIEKRNEDIAALTQAVISWKGKYFSIKDAKETIIDEKGETITIEPDCQACLEGKRFKVEFDKTEDYLNVTGFTLTNPAYAEVSVKWIKDLKLNIVLTRNKERNFRVYLDTNNTDFVPTKLELKIDPSVFEKKWYEKISLDGGMYVGDGFLVNFGVGYKIFNWKIGPSIMVGVTDRINRFYGFNVSWFPFERD